MLRILIVDDNPDAAGALAELAELWGHSIRVTLDGIEALRLAADFKPEVVLLDLGLPTLHGYRVAKMLREQAQGRRLLLIAVTGWNFLAEQESQGATSIDHYLTKPAAPDELKKLIDAYALGREA